MEKPGKTIWYFDYIPSYEQCFAHTVRYVFFWRFMTIYFDYIFYVNWEELQVKNYGC